MHCCYCQNFPWSQEGRGTEYTLEGFAGILTGLAEAGCHNWNLVTPTPWLPWIRRAVEAAKSDGFRLPVVYNSSGYENVDVLRQYGDIVDVYLVDLRYADDATALSASGAVRYVEAARASIEEMWRQKGPLKLDGSGTAVCGILCRILVLPGNAREAVRNLEWLARKIGTDIAVSIMSQYTPAYRARELPWSRKITEEEYDSVTAAAKRLGFTHGWIQEYGNKADPELVGFNMVPESGREETGVR